MQGIAVIHDLISERFPDRFDYLKRIVPITFNEQIATGTNEIGTVVRRMMKEVGTDTLIQMISAGSLVVSEADFDGIGQLTRLMAITSASGKRQFYIQAENGKGRTKDDHVYASYVVFCGSLGKVSMSKGVVENPFDSFSIGFI